MIPVRYCNWRLTNLFVLVPLILLFGHGFHRYHNGELSMPAAGDLPVKLPTLPVRFTFSRRQRSFETILAQLFRPILHPVAAETYTDAEGTIYENLNSIWMKPLGKKILILDVDTRYPRNMFHANESAHWETTHEEELLSQAIINHYTYAQIHGYDYRFFIANPIPNHDNHWSKIHAIAHYLSINTYDFIIYLDADASFRHMRLPLEWLLNRWNVTRHTSFAMALDPLDVDDVSGNPNSEPALNTGFIVAQNIPYTKVIMDAWMACTIRGLYVGCEKWKMQGGWEQSVFSEYLRWDYNVGGDVIRELPCGEANGFPHPERYDPIDCTGKFIRHHSLVKEATKETTANVMMQGLMDVLKEDFMYSARDIVMAEDDKVNHGGEAGHNLRPPAEHW